MRLAGASGLGGKITASLTAVDGQRGK